MNPFILLVIGFILVFFEFYLPGAVLGIAGGLFILVSIILFATQASALALAFYVAGICVGMFFLVKFALWRIKTAKPQRSIYDNSAQDGYQAVGYDASAIGKDGTVLTDLKPAGFILVDGKQHSAISVEGYLSKGTKVKVLSGEESILIVRKEEL